MIKALLRIFGKDGAPLDADAASFEKRRSPRLSYYIPCEVEGAKKSKSLIRNISFHGICLDTEFPVRPGDEFVVSFNIGSQRFENVKAKVVWAVKIATGFRCGVAFEEKWVKDIKKAVVSLMDTEA